MPCIVTMDLVVDCESILKISRESSMKCMKDKTEWDSGEKASVRLVLFHFLIS